MQIPINNLAFGTLAICLCFCGMLRSKSQPALNGAQAASNLVAEVSRQWMRGSMSGNEAMAEIVSILSHHAIASIDLADTPDNSTGRDK
jgi:hypothetical protein